MLIGQWANMTLRGYICLLLSQKIRAPGYVHLQRFFLISLTFVYRSLGGPLLTCLSLQTAFTAVWDPHLDVWYEFEIDFVFVRLPDTYASEHATLWLHWPQHPFMCHHLPYGKATGYNHPLSYSALCKTF